MKIEIRETDQKDKSTSERMSDNKMNHVTLDLEVRIYIPTKPDKVIKKDMERIYQVLNFNKHFLCH